MPATLSDIWTLGVLPYSCAQLLDGIWKHDATPKGVPEEQEYKNTLQGGIIFGELIEYKASLQSIIKEQ